MERTTPQQKTTLRLTVATALIDLALAVVKVLFGTLTGIQAITADGIHAFSDFVTDCLVALFLRLSRRPASRTRPYGHRKLEAVAALGMAALLVLTALWMIGEAIADLGEREALFPSAAAIALTLAAIAVKEALFWVTLFQGRKARSAALVANAWHHRSDVLSSVAVLVCLVLGAWFGSPSLWDLLGVTAVAVLIARAAWEIARGSFAELLDYAPPAEILANIEALAEADPEVVLVHDLRVRTVGGTYHITMTLELAGERSVAEGHAVVERLKGRLREAVRDVYAIHIETAPAGAYAARIRATGLENLKAEDLL